MSSLAEARRLDAADELVDAAACYERAIRETIADVSVCIDLAVLYFVLLDFGEVTARGLSPDFRESAWQRAIDILDGAEERFGKSADIEFWRRYMRWSYLGERFDVDACRELAEKATTLDPHAFLFTATEGRESREEASQLRERTRAGATARERYLFSILNSAAARRW